MKTFRIALIFISFSIIGALQAAEIEELQINISSAVSPSGDKVEVWAEPLLVKIGTLLFYRFNERDDEEIKTGFILHATPVVTFISDNAFMVVFSGTDNQHEKNRLFSILYDKNKGWGEVIAISGHVESEINPRFIADEQEIRLEWDSFVDSNTGYVTRSAVWTKRKWQLDPLQSPLSFREKAVSAKQYELAAIGDSVQVAIANQVAGMGISVNNMSQGGTATIHSAPKASSAGASAEVVFVGGGTNDPDHGISWQTSVQNQQGAVAVARNQGAKVIFMNIAPQSGTNQWRWDGHGQYFNNAVGSAGSDRFINAQGCATPDGLHPTPCYGWISSDITNYVNSVVIKPTFPDLIVQSPSVSDSTLTPGQSFTAYGTVKNQGSGSSASTTLRYYQSTDSTISWYDTPIGTDYVNSLSSGAISSENISLSAPTTTGTYYIGACVDSVSGESNSGNNCSNGVQVIVRNPPDLIVQSPSVSNSTLTPGQSFTAYATVKNQGSGSSASTTLRYYQSTDSTISSYDTPIGTDYVNSLSSGAISSENIFLSAPTTTGTYYIGACVDSVSGESNSGNNCSNGVQIIVRNPPLSAVYLLLLIDDDE